MPPAIINKLINLNSVTMAKRPSKPKLKNLPKRPKTNAALSVWEKYHENVKKVQTENRKRMSDFEKNSKAYDASIKKRNDLVKKSQGLGKI